MSRTTWRGVRFGLDGSTWTYLKLASGWTLLSAITLGFAYLLMQIDLWRYQIRHTRIGSEIFKFEGNAKDLMWPWVTVYIPMGIYTVTHGHIRSLALPSNLKISEPIRVWRI